MCVNDLRQPVLPAKPKYCKLLLAGRSNSTTKPLQMIQNVASVLKSVKEKRTHVTPLLILCNWLQVADIIKFKVLMLVFMRAIGTALPYLNALLQCFLPAAMVTER